MREHIITNFVGKLKNADDILFQPKFYTINKNKYESAKLLMMTSIQDIIDEKIDLNKLKDTYGYALISKTIGKVILIPRRVDITKVELVDMKDEPIGFKVFKIDEETGMPLKLSSSEEDKLKEANKKYYEDKNIFFCLIYYRKAGHMWGYEDPVELQIKNILGKLEKEFQLSLMEMKCKGQLDSDTDFIIKSLHPCENEEEKSIMYNKIINMLNKVLQKYNSHHIIELETFDENYSVILKGKRR